MNHHFNVMILLIVDFTLNKPDLGWQLERSALKFTDAIRDGHSLAR